MLTYLLRIITYKPEHTMKTSSPEFRDLSRSHNISTITPRQTLQNNAITPIKFPKAYAKMKNH